MDPTPLIAFALDLALGDPPSWPHPVRLLGLALDRLEALARGRAASRADVASGLHGQDQAGARPGDAASGGLPAGAGTVATPALPGEVSNPETDAASRRSPVFLRLFGAATLLGLGGAAAGAAYLLARLPLLGYVIALYLSFAGLALGQLLRETRRVARLMETQRLDEARAALGRLVSRDTSALDEAGVWRTLAETLSENFCDAFVAPFFYLSLGGPALLWFYKTASTMDSMWGYKTPRFKDLGWAGARADDLLAFVPARLSAGLLLVCGAAMGLRWADALRHTRRDAARMQSPNAGWPMAASAWLCGAAMGGPAVYHGRLVIKPILGLHGSNWDADRAATLITLVKRAGFCMLVSWVMITLLLS
ncbi:Cobalamin biosynthesis protein CobD [Fundidesulfovibrio magnetotacticus]|uniref:Cobalamin biosynthesis protein CobD n=1 Tax=Fundidesulfovibrio magnetotacticus TaxID=2730080 RepID=A0A6V8LQ88_9BACT|nr:CobD/CbiB family cobalamin biosynthesis protein [Fundidesulfovibrio magnetotacticus]GFK93140.1 Cobalamin biosynthesis protein CobD [Fundidesulfovibrio magnetotacticus]